MLTASALLLMREHRAPRWTEIASILWQCTAYGSSIWSGLDRVTCMTWSLYQQLCMRYLCHYKQLKTEMFLLLKAWTFQAWVALLS